ncbi:MAG TPA: DUF2267 domain-containing protein [Kofleriaceae bacterium]|nr:DUF2267 domain-containing protein [Kofleriaceae bacterium]
MTAEDFIARVADHAGIPIGRAEAATRVVLSSLGSYLPRGRCDEVAAELPPTLRRDLLDAAGAAIPVEERLLALADNRAARAHELLASVCHVLAELLSNEALSWLSLALPARVGRLFERPAPERSADDHAAGRDDTLASGNLGSHHAIADQAADRSQSESVASSDPHGATKLSSSSGTTQERRHDTLAEARGDDRRELATAKP